MATKLISDFREDLRHLLDDRDPTLPVYEDAHLDRAVGCLVRMGGLSGVTVDAAGQCLTSDAELTATEYALLLLKTVRSFYAPMATGESFRTRAISWTRSRPVARILSDLDEAVARLERVRYAGSDTDADAGVAWSTYRTFLNQVMVG